MLRTRRRRPVRNCHVTSVLSARHGLVFSCAAIRATIPPPTLTRSTEGTPDAESAPPSENRRRQDRFSVELDVSLENEHNFYAGFVENLSSSGLFIATHSIRPIGSQVEFSIAIGESPEPVKGLGEVRWVRQYSETSDAHPGMGLRFIELAPEGRKRIEEFLVGREPIFYDDDL